jgi:hypothetical protein
MNRDKLKILIAVVLAVLFVRFIVLRSDQSLFNKFSRELVKEPSAEVKKIKTLDEIPCLTWDLELVQHVHPILKVFINDKQLPISANIGLEGDCQRVLHTHDTSGKIHLESQDRVKYTLQDFFTVWGERLDRRGYILEMTVNNEPFDADQSAPGDLVLKTKQEIVLKYTRK